jgi:hypothetical protein
MHLRLSISIGTKSNIEATKQSSFLRAKQESWIASLALAMTVFLSWLFENLI